MKKEHTTAGLKYRIRKAGARDVREIQKLINLFGTEGVMLPRSLSEIYETLRDFHVCEADERVLGVSALHIAWEDLAEIKSVAVAPEFQKRGIGTKLVRICLDEAAVLNVKRVFTLTYKSEFFQKFGFKIVDKEILPQKIWGECIRCLKFPDCNETAMMIEIAG